MNFFLKTFCVFLIGILFMPISFAYNKTYSVWVTGSTTRADIYNIPTGKKLLIQKIMVDEYNQSHIWIRDNGGTDLSYWDMVDHIYSVNLLVEEILQVKTERNGIHITIEGLLLDEDEDESIYVDGEQTAWTKHIFNKEDIDFIYFREFIIMFFLTIGKFFSIVLWKNFNIL